MLTATVSYAYGPSVMKALGTLEVRDREHWHRWLAKHHASSSGVWLVYRKGQAAVQSISYEHSLREALCVGWIDSWA